MTKSLRSSVGSIGRMILFAFVCLNWLPGSEGSTNSTTGMNGNSTTGMNGNSTGQTLTGGETTGFQPPPHEVSCNNYTECSKCVKSVKCVWCQSEDLCYDGTWLGATGKNCKGITGDWRWMQCQVQGNYLLIAAGGTVFLILCVITTCICCCCCCKTKSKKKKKDRLEFNSISDREIEKEGLIKHPKTSARREELAKKYSFLRKDELSIQSANSNV